MVLRRETRNDYRVVEEITSKAFLNVHVPGCNEVLSGSCEVFYKNTSEGDTVKNQSNIPAGLRVKWEGIYQAALKEVSDVYGIDNETAVKFDM